MASDKEIIAALDALAAKRAELKRMEADLAVVQGIYRQPMWLQMMLLKRDIDARVEWLNKQQGSQVK